MKLSLFDVRNNEIDLLIEKRKARFTPGSKFVNLFKTPIGPIINNWETVSLTIDMTIRGEVAPTSQENKDVTFGSYEEKMPRGLSRSDQYHFFTYVLLKDDRFCPQSGECIVGVGGVITKLKMVNMVDVCMGSMRLIGTLVNKCNKNKTESRDLCTRLYA